MEQLTTNIEGSRVGLLPVEAEFVRTELELAYSLLDVAAVSEVRKIFRRCVRNALAALRTADRFLARAAADACESADISRRQEELLKRVREVARRRVPV